jgi:DNA-binding NarL/FixJ family response regulator
LAESAGFADDFPFSRSGARPISTRGRRGTRGTKEGTVITEPHGPARVLVVDDHDLVAETLRRALSLEPEFVVVGCVGSVSAAVQTTCDVHPDVVVMDFRLPDGTGAEATALVKIASPTTEVVMLTGQASGAILAQAMEAGCSGFVAKDGSFEELIDTLRAVIRGEVRVPRELVEELAKHLRPRPPSLGDDLTAREREVLELLAAGCSTPQMVAVLVVSVHTVRNHVRNILTKLQARSRLEAVAVATRAGLIGSRSSREHHVPA